MRAVALLVFIVGIFSASHASEGTDSLATVGKELVSSLVEHGKDLLTQAVSSLGGLLENFNLSLTIGKRHVLHEALTGAAGKFKDLLEKGKQLSSKIFGDTLNKLKAIAQKFHERLGLLKDDKEVTADVDAAVADHDGKQKRVLKELLAKGKDILGSLTDKLKSVASSLATAVKAKASEVVSGLLQKGVNLIGKRHALSEHLKTIGNVISNAVSPFKDIVSGLGNTLKGHFSNLVDTVKGHVNTLKDKLSGHVDDLKAHGAKLLDHGKNALGALSEVVKDVLSQTLKNAKPDIDGAIKKLGDVTKVAVDHVAGY